MLVILNFAAVSGICAITASGICTFNFSNLKELAGITTGAAAGALVGFVSALDAAKLSAQDLAEMSDNQRQNTQQNLSASQKYIQAQQEYAKLLASGASSDKLELASKNLSESFNQITDVKLADELSKTKGGVEALNSVLSKYETDKNILTSATTIALPWSRI